MGVMAVAAVARQWQWCIGVMRLQQDRLRCDGSSGSSMTVSVVHRGDAAAAGLTWVWGKLACVTLGLD